MNKEELLKKELSYIKDKDIKESLKKLLNMLPEYFYIVPASSSGKYHPKYALGNGGLLRHSKSAMRIGYELLGDPAIGDKYTDKEKDMLLFAILVHDGLKLGIPEEKHTKFDHPILMQKFIYDNKEELSLSEEEAIFIGDAIKTHMGPWTKDYDGNEVLEAPHTKYQNFVHMCDFLASRKFLEVPFDENNNILE